MTVQASVQDPEGVVRAAPLDTDVAIETPEHIVFRHRVAGPARRLIAYAIDLLLCYGAFTLVATLVIFAAAGANALSEEAEAMGAATGILLVLLFVIQWVYFALLEGWRGKTPGKSLLGLRVVTTMGRPHCGTSCARRTPCRSRTSPAWCRWRPSPR
jgi:hypothetical protein